MRFEKKTLRVELRQRLQKVSAMQREQFSTEACALLQKQLIWQNAKFILFYAPFSDELNIWPLVSDALAEKKTVILPQFNRKTSHYIGCQITHLENDLTIGQFGIREPKSHCGEILLKHLDLALVPGVGFDPMGRRLGRGKGFYDRLLAQISGTKCGVAFDEQIVETIPTEAHDVHLNYILTPTRWLEAMDQREV